MDVHYILRNSIIKKKNWFVTGRNVMYNMHKESRSGNKKNEQGVNGCSGRTGTREKYQQGNFAGCHWAVPDPGLQKPFW